MTNYDNEVITRPKNTVFFWSGLFISEMSTCMYHYTLQLFKVQRSMEMWFVSEETSNNVFLFSCTVLIVERCRRVPSPCHARVTRAGGLRTITRDDEKEINILYQCVSTCHQSPIIAALPFHCACYSRLQLYCDILMQYLHSSWRFKLCPSRSISLGCVISLWMRNYNLITATVNVIILPCSKTSLLTEAYSCLFNSSRTCYTSSFLYTFTLHRTHAGRKTLLSLECVPLLEVSL